MSLDCNNRHMALAVFYLCLLFWWGVGEGGNIWYSVIPSLVSTGLSWPAKTEKNAEARYAPKKAQNNPLNRQVSMNCTTVLLGASCCFTDIPVYGRDDPGAVKCRSKSRTSALRLAHHCPSDSLMILIMHLLQSKIIIYIIFATMTAFGHCYSSSRLFQFYDFPLTNLSSGFPLCKLNSRCRFPTQPGNHSDN